MTEIKKRTKQIPISLTDEMRAGLERLRQETGLSMAAIVRLAVREYLAKK